MNIKVGVIVEHEFINNDNIVVDAMNKINSALFNESKMVEYITYYVMEGDISWYKVNANDGRLYYRSVGDALRNEQYDVIYLSSPRCLDRMIEIDAKHVWGMAYDMRMINSLFEKGISNLQDFSTQRRGYEYYNRICEAIICQNDRDVALYTKAYRNTPPVFVYNDFESLLDLMK